MAADTFAWPDYSIDRNGNARRIEIRVFRGSW